MKGVWVEDTEKRRKLNGLLRSSPYLMMGKMEQNDGRV